MHRHCFSLASLLLALAMSSCGDSEPAFEGTWTGTLETGSLPSGSMLVTLEVEAAVIGEPVLATVVFGEGAAPAAPTDPDVGWPEGIDPNLEAVPVADGFVYESTGATRSGDTLSIPLAITELWEPWCALQETFPVEGGGTEAQCLPNRPWDATPFECVFEADAENPVTPVDCLKLTLCRRTRVCTCTTTGGCVPSSTGLTLNLDVTLDGDEAIGILRWASEDPELSSRTARVRFTR